MGLYNELNYDTCWLSELSWQGMRIYEAHSLNNYKNLNLVPASAVAFFVSKTQFAIFNSSNLRGRHNLRNL
tara:strand:- start:183 stop:395 length:213 start_codon:yes stop_codon:yes gene_type:complete